MSLTDLVNNAKDKTRFTTVKNYVDFCLKYLTFARNGLQAEIVSQNETNYRFFQYKADGGYRITRPLNANLMYSVDDSEALGREFPSMLRSAREIEQGDPRREVFLRSIYTIQQTIGAALDALPGEQSNTARKVNGDLFERFISLLVNAVGVSCQAGVVQVPIVVDGNNEGFMSYQHDLIIKNENELKIIGSVKTSSKDRIDKIFLDKFLYSKLTETSIPHIAIFLNDVQRKKGRLANQYGVNSTFLSGHFRAFTIKLNALDGVYYCDLRPNMKTDAVLSRHIRTIDNFFFGDLWSFMGTHGLIVAKEEVVDGEIVEVVEP
ncbi:MAG: hypothetical protein WKF55_03560 [Gemmatimonadaceae bacterium]